MSFRLGDDGTMDTVVVCDECGAELRYNYSNEMDADDSVTDEANGDAYDAFVAGAIADAESEHECGGENDV